MNKLFIVGFFVIAGSYMAKAETLHRNCAIWSDTTAPLKKVQFKTKDTTAVYSATQPYEIVQLNVVHKNKQVEIIPFPFITKDTIQMISFEDPGASIGYEVRAHGKGLVTRVTFQKDGSETVEVFIPADAPRASGKFQRKQGKFVKTIAL